MVVMKLVVNESSEKRSSRQLLPTPLSPISSSLMRKSYDALRVAMTTDEQRRRAGRAEQQRTSGAQQAAADTQSTTAANVIEARR